jgi:hypothetical protein
MGRKEDRLRAGDPERGQMLLALDFPSGARVRAGKSREVRQFAGGAAEVVPHAANDGGAGRGGQAGQRLAEVCLGDA